MTHVLALFTCFNRKEKTETCIRTLADGNPDCRFSFIVADDNSTDGTPALLQEMTDAYDITVLHGDGGLFYSGGMRLAMKAAREVPADSYDYVLLMNDDVAFAPSCIERMVMQSTEQNGAVVIGATCDEQDRQSYGAVKYTKGTHYRKLSIEERDVEADTFNANCVLIPAEAFRSTPIMDEHYVHSLGDFDYGLSLKRNGYHLRTSDFYVGVCSNNSNKGTWTDPALTRRERLKKKKSPKGAPAKQWYYFLKKNFGFLTAVKGVVTPYIRILLGK